jgi:hypothetical protein
LQSVGKVNKELPAVLLFANGEKGKAQGTVLAYQKLCFGFDDMSA